MPSCHVLQSINKWHFDRVCHKHVFTDMKICFLNNILQKRDKSSCDLSSDMEQCQAGRLIELFHLNITYVIYMKNSNSHFFISILPPE